MLLDTHRRVLEQVLTALQGTDVAWALTGSTSFALQGVDVLPNDIDIQADEKAAYAIEGLLARIPDSRIVRPVRYSESPSIRSHFGEMQVEGHKVEIMGALQKRLATGDWEQPVDVARLRVFVEWGPFLVPVLPLEYERRAYLLLGRKDRAELLAAFLKQRCTEG